LEGFGELLRKASCKEDPRKAAPGRRREHGVNFLAKSRWWQLGNLVEILMLMSSAEPWGLSHPIPRDFLCDSAA